MATRSGGVVGLIHPTQSGEGHRELTRLMPAEITMIPTFLNVRDQVESEFQAAFEPQLAMAQTTHEEGIVFGLQMPAGARAGKIGRDGEWQKNPTS